MEKRERIAYWDNLKGILILLVVLGHYVETVMGNHPGLTWLWTAIYSFHMPAFVLVSGHFLTKSRRNPVERIPRVVGLYLLMAALYAVRPLLYGKGLGIQLASPKYGCWFLLFLAYGYVLASFLRAGWNGGADSSHNRMLFFSTVLAALLAGFDTSIGRPWGVGQSFYFMPYLIGGAVFGLDKAVSWARAHRPVCALAFLLIQLGLFFAGRAPWFNRKIFRGIETYEELMGTPILGMAGRAAGYVIAAALVVCLLGFIPQRCSALTVIGRHTLVIYLVHTFMIKNIYPELQRFPVLGGIGRLAVLSVLIAAVCVLLVWAQGKIQKRKVG